LSGGWGAAYDLGFSDLLGEKIADAYYSEKKPIIGGICHGVLGLIRAKNKEGGLLIQGRKMTGVTDKQITELGINLTPQHPETELRKAGVIFQSETRFTDIFANLTVVDDEKRFVTGQNQNAGHETSYKIMNILAKRGN
jgi:putative intracellular protease/amidase